MVKAWLIQKGSRHVAACGFSRESQDLALFVGLIKKKNLCRSKSLYIYIYMNCKWSLGHQFTT